jgi:hypothetical protein
MLNIKPLISGTQLALYVIERKAYQMEKATKLFVTMMEYCALAVVTFGYWIEMAEDIEVKDTIEKVGKHALILAKLLFFK